MSGQYWEEYSCGCVSPKSSKKNLLGYCSRHGNDRRALYKGDMPADEATLDIHRRTYAAIRAAALAAEEET